MPIYDVIFYFFAVTLVLSALGVVSTKNAVTSVLFLVLSFFFKFSFVDDVACRISFVSSHFLVRRCCHGAVSLCLDDDRL